MFNQTPQQGAPRPAMPPPPPPPQQHAPAAAAPKPPGKDYWGIRRQWVLMIVIVGAALSLYLGTKGLSYDISVGSQFSVPAPLRWLFALATLASVNLRQFAYALQTKSPTWEENWKWNLRKLGFYLVDFLFVWMGAGGLENLTFILTHRFNQDPVTWIVTAALFILAIVIGYAAAVLIEEFLVDDWKHQNEAKKIKPVTKGFEERRKKFLLASGWIGSINSFAASGFGTYVLSQIASPALSTAEKAEDLILSIAFGFFLQLVELVLTQKRKLSRVQRWVLNSAFAVDMTVMFAAIGGFGLLIDASGNSILFTIGGAGFISLIGKMLTAWNSAVESELSINEGLFVGVEVPKAVEEKDEKPAAATPAAAPDPNAWMQKIVTPDKIPDGWQPLQVGNRPLYTTFVNPENRSEFVFVENVKLQQARPVVSTSSQVPPPPQQNPVVPPPPPQNPVVPPPPPHNPAVPPPPPQAPDSV